MIGNFGNFFFGDFCDLLSKMLQSSFGSLLKGKRQFWFGRFLKEKIYYLPNSVKPYELDIRATRANLMNKFPS